MLVCRLALTRGHGHDGDLDERGPGGVRPGLEIAQASLFLSFAQGHRVRIGLACVCVAADLEPGLMVLVPAEQDSPGPRMHDDG